MKILIIGGNGTIGKKVSAHFSKNHEVIVGARQSGDVTVDMADSRSVKSMFRNHREGGCGGLYCRRRQMG
jgi:dTDP-4-dehydrorhamnose reductase